MKNNAAILIPARLASTRVPNKLLHPFQGISALQHVIRRVKKQRYNLEIIVATPDEKICEISEYEGVRYVLTSHKHETGTQRCSEAIKSVDLSHIIIVQGDEVLIQSGIIDQLYEDIMQDTLNCSWNVIAPVSLNDLIDESVVKCSVDGDFITECSRKKINGEKNHYQLQGVFAFKRTFLLHKHHKLTSRRADRESIEQLALIENGYPIKAIHVDNQMRSLNTSNDIPLILAELEKEKS